MTDLGLRKRTRDAVLGGPVEQARLLRARLRAGEVARREVDLAAYLGHGAARELTGARSVDDLSAWVDGLSAWGEEVVVRAAVTCAWLALPLFESPEERYPELSLPEGYCCEWCTPRPSATWVEPYEDDRPRRAAEAAEAWLAGRASATESSLRLAATGATAAGLTWDPAWSGHWAALSCAAAAEAAAGEGCGAARDAVANGIEALRLGWCYERGDVWRFVREAVASCLVDWAV